MRRPVNSEPRAAPSRLVDGELLICISPHVRYIAPLVCAALEQVLDTALPKHRLQQIHLGAAGDSSGREIRKKRVMASPSGRPQR